MGNEGIYSVGKEFGKANKLFAKQMVSRVLRVMALILKHSRNSLPGMTLHLPVMCSTCGSFAGKLLVRHLRKPLVYPLKLESSHSVWV